MPFANQVSARQNPPGRYKKFRRENGKFGAGIDVIWGITPNGKTEIQSVRFDSHKYSTEEARKWLKEHNMKTGVTAATGSPKDHDEGGAPASAGTAAPANSASAITVTTANRNDSYQYKLFAEEATVEVDNDEMLDSIVDNDVDMDELKMGMKHETEHTDDKKLAMRLALDHLIEIPDYYTRLKAAFPEDASDFAAKPDKKDIEMSGDGVEPSEKEEDLDDDDYELGFSADAKELCVEAFEAGEHTDAAGQTASWSESDLDDIASKANEQIPTKPIPVTLGHPIDSSPAYGWVKSVKRFGEKLRVKLGELNPGFVEALKNGAYKGRSISLYDDNKMRHLGFLGGSQPAITGLQPLAFNDGEPYRVYTFSEDIEMDKAKEQELSFYQKLLKKFGVDVEKERKEFSEEKPAEFHEAMGVVAQEKGAMAAPKTDGKAIQEDIKAKETKDPGEQDTAKKENAAIINEANEEEDENAKLRALVETLTTRVNMLESSAAKMKQSNSEFCEQLIKDGLLLPRDKDITMMGLDAQEQIDKVKNFSEGDEHSSLTAMKNLLKKQPKVVQFGEFPNLPGVEETKEFPAPTDMGAYVETRMKECMTEQDKIGLTPKISYGDMMKGVHRECAEKWPVAFKEYVTTKLLPPRA